ncbi:MAG: RHS repeat-associated core domain-containing protein, partial [Planctomycetota bacterium]
RIGKAVDEAAPFDMVDAAIERYIIDDIHGVASDVGGNVALDFVDPDGDGPSPLELKHRRLFGNAVDQILAQEDISEPIHSADRVQWPLVDNLGTVRDLVSNDGTLGEHYTYDAFGNITSGDTSAFRYLYTSREHDPDTGLQYNRARWYDAATGRWLSQDPLGFAAGDVNLYRYVGNGSTNASDPSGLWTFGEFMDAFGSAYVDYVNPWNDSVSVPVDGLDVVLTVGTKTGQVVGVGSGLAAGGIVVTGVGTGVTITGGTIATTVGTEIIDTLIEEALSAVSGVPVIIPLGPVDLVQDGIKVIGKKRIKDAIAETAENGGKKISGCFLAGTPVLVGISGVDESSEALATQVTESQNESSREDWSMALGITIICASVYLNAKYWSRNLRRGYQPTIATYGLRLENLN